MNVFVLVKWWEWLSFEVLVTVGREDLKNLAVAERLLMVLKLFFISVQTFR